MNNLYTVKSLLKEATEMEKYAKQLITHKQTKQHKKWADKLIKKAIPLEQEAEIKYKEITGEYLHHKDLKDLFGIQ